MKQTLRALFKNYGEVLDVVAHRNLRMRGQAFVSFPNVEVAKKAQKEVKGFPLYGKPMASAFMYSLSSVV
jgi:U2 small nuclear ribonucleoprotein B''